MSYREWRETRFRLSGDLSAAQKLIGYGRKVLGKLRTDIAEGASLGDGVRRERPDENTRIEARVIQDQFQVMIHVEPQYPVAEIREEPPVEIALPVAEIPEPEIPVPTFEQDLYIPYLWVGVRIESVEGEIGSVTDGHGNAIAPDYDNMPQLMLNVWEPAPRETEDREPAWASTRWGGSDGSGDTDVYPAAASILHAIELMDNFEWRQHPDTLFNGSTFVGTNELYHTDHNLYLMGHPFNWDPLYDPDDPDDEYIWEQVAILDPNDPEKDWSGRTFRSSTALGPYDFHADALEPFQLPGRVLPGDYIIQVSAWNYNECIDLPVNVLLEVRLGKPGGRHARRRFRFRIEKPINMLSMINPYGLYDWGHTTGEPGDGYGPNPFGSNWWQGAVRVNINGGHVPGVPVEAWIREVEGPGMDEEEMERYALNEGRDLPFEPGEDYAIYGCGSDCTRGATPYAGSDFVAIDYRDHPTLGGRNIYPPYHLAWMQAVVTGLNNAQVCEVQIANFCEGVCEPLGNRNVWRAKPADGDPGPWSMGQSVWVTALDFNQVGVSTEAHLLAKYLVSPLWLKANLTCGTLPALFGGHKTVIEDIIAAGYEVECVGGIETIVKYPDWHQNSQ